MARVQQLGPRAQRTRAAILAAAESVFAERGFASARLEDVAAQVEIRRASLVYYFRDKRALYEAVLQNLLGELQVRYQTVVDGPGTIPQKLDRVTTVWLEYLAERPALSRIVLREAAESSPVSAVLADGVRPLIKAVLGLVVEGQQLRLFDPVDPLRFVLTIAGTTIFYDTFAQMLDAGRTHHPGPPSKPAGHTDEVLRILRRLVGTRPLRAVPSRSAGGRRRLT
jgi:TetR/AcrR family transcriptional regulator